MATLRRGSPRWLAFTHDRIRTAYALSPGVNRATHVTLVAPVRPKKGRCNKRKKEKEVLLDRPDESSEVGSVRLSSVPEASSWAFSYDNEIPILENPDSLTAIWRKIRAEGCELPSLERMRERDACVRMAVVNTKSASSSLIAVLLSLTLSFATFLLDSNLWQSRNLVPTSGQFSRRNTSRLSTNCGGSIMPSKLNFLKMAKLGGTRKASDNSASSVGDRALNDEGHRARDFLHRYAFLVKDMQASNEYAALMEGRLANFPSKEEIAGERSKVEIGKLAKIVTLLVSLLPENMMGVLAVVKNKLEQKKKEMAAEIRLQEVRACIEALTEYNEGGFELEAELERLKDLEISLEVDYGLASVSDLSLSRLDIPQISGDSVNQD
ncbi:hypothetical protein HID58_044308 [Brassica napus]|uniref:Uncharacterized protein n=1 Tax=Brassica napus TaxID=3708 RepID=A0ABQ8BJ07_BRANA|nr:hypothetical protein HID58_044308 [Brassica napus]